MIRGGGAKKLTAGSSRIINNNTFNPV